MRGLTSWLKAALAISKTEANGYLPLIFFIAICIAIPYVIKTYSMEVSLEENSSTLDSLVADINRNVQFDSSNTYKSTQKRRSTVKKENTYQKRTPKHDKRVRPDRKKTTYKVKKTTLRPFDINLADTIQLKKIYGIGTVLSSRIVKYRDLLGGFVSKSQLAEVYGLSDSVLNALDTITYISSDHSPVKILINETSLNSLRKHPYISNKVAGAIDNYKYQHGNVKDSKDLYTIHLLDSLSIAKIIPYIEY